MSQPRSRTVELADVVRRWRQAHADKRLAPVQRRALRAITDCRTGKLGRHAALCEQCGALSVRYHSCRNRHCPKCQGLARQRWVDARLADLLPVPYVHAVFTVPHDINPLVQSHPTLIYRQVFEAVAQTLQAFGANPRWLGGELSITLVLHTWSQTLDQHVHVHALIGSGALTAQDRWVHAKPGFLFPVRALSRVFRGKFLGALTRAYNDGQLYLRAGQASLSDETQFNDFVMRLKRINWVVYAKQPFAGPRQVIEYLGRYTHRTAIGNERLRALTEDGVEFSYRDRKNGKRKRVMRLPVDEFMRRFLLHILPSGFMRIRHYGLLANRGKRTKLARCRRALQARTPEPLESLDVRAFIQRTLGVDINVCAHCGVGALHSLYEPRLSTGPPSTAPC